MATPFSIYVINFLQQTTPYFALMVQQNSITGQELFSKVQKAFSLSQDKTRYCLIPTNTKPKNVSEANIAYSNETLVLEEDECFSLIDEPEHSIDIVEAYFSQEEEVYSLSFANKLKMNSKIKTSEVRSHVFNLFHKTFSPIRSITFRATFKYAKEKEHTPGDYFFTGIDISLMDSMGTVFLVQFEKGANATSSTEKDEVTVPEPQKEIEGLVLSERSKKHFKKQYHAFSNEKSYHSKKQKKMSNSLKDEAIISTLSSADSIVFNFGNSVSGNSKIEVVATGNAIVATNNNNLSESSSMKTTAGPHSLVLNNNIKMTGSSRLITSVNDPESAKMAFKAAEAAMKAARERQQAQKK